jgi:hypothetical protein
MVFISTTGDTILRFPALRSRFDKLLPVVQLAMSAGLPYIGIADLIVAHPTLKKIVIVIWRISATCSLRKNC